MNWSKLAAALAVLVTAGLAMGGLAGLPAVFGDVRAVASLAVALGLVALLTIGGVTFRRTRSNPYW